MTNMLPKYLHNNIYKKISKLLIIDNFNRFFWHRLTPKKFGKYYKSEFIAKNGSNRSAKTELVRSA